MKPQRIQRKRTKGWKMPQNTVYVGRPTYYGNPFAVGEDGDARECVNAYAEYLYCPLPNHPSRDRFPAHQLIMRHLIRQNLRGKNLACWCRKDSPCHADILLQFANGDDPV